MKPDHPPAGPRPRRTIPWQRWAGPLLFAALTAAGAQIRVQIFAIPFTLQSMAVYGSGLFLGWPGGMISQAAYLLLGLFFPVFAGEGLGWDYLIHRPTSGYLWGFLLSSGVIGWLSGRTRGPGGYFLAVAAGSVVLFGCGVTWLHLAAAHPTWGESLRKGWLNLWYVDLAKIVFTVTIYSLYQRYGNRAANPTASL